MGVPIPPDLQGLHRELKEYIHDCSCDERMPDWPAATAKALIERIAQLEVRVSSLKAEARKLGWTKIDDNHLPKEGDELLSVDQETGEVFDLYIVSRRNAADWTASDYIEDWCPYFRSLNFPEVK